MAVLGQGTAHGACSLLHAAGTGYGASMALDLPILVRVLDKKSKRDVHDDDLLTHLIEAWKNAGHALYRLKKKDALGCAIKDSC